MQRQANRASPILKPYELAIEDRSLRHHADERRCGDAAFDARPAHMSSDLQPYFHVDQICFVGLF